ncbi:MAG TPA: TSUP family transporter [Roseateles sp.]
MQSVLDGMGWGGLAWVAASFVLAGFVKGVSGMGLPTLAMALLSLQLPAASAAALMLLPALLTNAAQCLGRHGAELLRRLWPLWLGLILGTLWIPLPGLGSGTARRALGVVLVGYGLFGLARARLPAPGAHAGWVGLLAGGIGGALSAATGVFVMPLVPYLQALQLPRAALIQALGISFTLASLALAARLGQERVAWPSAVALAVAMGAAWGGMALGARWRERLPTLAFQRALYAVFLLLGALMILPPTAARPLA